MSSYNIICASGGLTTSAKVSSDSSYYLSQPLMRIQRVKIFQKIAGTVRQTIVAISAVYAHILIKKTRLELSYHDTQTAPCQTTQCECSFLVNGFFFLIKTHDSSQHLCMPQRGDP